MKKLTKKDKILYTIAKMFNKNKNELKYEDILVTVFKSFPGDFQLRFYSEYPDTDTIRRALYQLIPEGYIRISQRNCSLTKEGKIRGNELIKFIDGDSIEVEGRRDANFGAEIKRLSNLDGYKMFLLKNFEAIIDQDFYEFYRTSVRTKNLELLGKMKQIHFVIDRYIEENKKKGKLLKDYAEFLQNKFLKLFYEEAK